MTLFFAFLCSCLFIWCNKVNIMKCVYTTRSGIQMRSRASCVLNPLLHMKNKQSKQAFDLIFFFGSLFFNIPHAYITTINRKHHRNDALFIFTCAKQADAHTAQTRLHSTSTKDAPTLLHPPLEKPSERSSIHFTVVLAVPIIADRGSADPSTAMPSGRRT